MDPIANTFIVCAVKIKNFSLISIKPIVLNNTNIKNFIFILLGSIREISSYSYIITSVFLSLLKATFTATINILS